MNGGMVFLYTGYEKVFDELNNELTELEAKPFYDLFKKLYCSNYSLRNELEQVSRKYYKMHELVKDKSQYVERLYDLLQILRKPEIRILSLLKALEDENIVPLENTVAKIITNNEHSAILDIYKEFDNLVEQIKNDSISSSALENLCKKKTDSGENSRKNEKNTIKSEDRYWKILKQYYYNLRDGVFLDASLSKIKNDLIRQNVISAWHSRGELKKDLKQIRDKNYVGKRH